MDTNLVSIELDEVSARQENKIKKLRRQLKLVFSLEEKLSIQKKIQISEKVLHALRVNRFNLEDSSIY